MMVKPISNPCNSTESQRRRLLQALAQAGNTGITTIQAREDLDVMQPAPRIHELRHNFGHNIVTAWKIEENAQGRKHRNGRYVLIPGKYRKS